jgi:precorrin-6Y C5,15-methyltransferase (decarboxylating)
MSAPWLHIIGIGEDGMAGLSSAARALVENAEVIVGGDRHHALSPNVRAERIAWPSPFDAMIGTLKSLKGRRAVVLVTGDPLWYSVGARILKGIPASEIAFHPQLSAFQFAACRMGWSLADVETLTIHGRPAEQIVPFFAPGARLLVLTKDGSSPATVARLLAGRGYGPSRLTVLAALGGPDEARIEGSANGWHANVPDFHTLAVECIAAPDAQLLPLTGLPDSAFRHDGKMTKRAVRALALSRLVPQRGALLWDIGCGCGSVAIEWMRAAREARAIGIEPRADRRAIATENALALGAPALELVEGDAPAALAGLRAPDAVFIGGGIGMATIETAIAALKPLGRLVANAVTLESEAVLLDAFARHGGELERISVQAAEPVGPYHGWRASMPVTQWSWQKALTA